MKKTIAITLGILMMSLSSFATNSVERIDKNEIKNMSQGQRETRVQELENRVTEIRNSDLRALNKSEKKDVKSELSYIEKELKTHERSGGGIYISVTALLVIILLIIIL